MVRGHHSTLTPVALPDWVPRHIIEDMVGRLQKYLRLELDAAIAKYLLRKIAMAKTGEPRGKHRSTPSGESNASALSVKSADNFGDEHSGDVTKWEKE
jgi:hypothetical protein